MIKKNIKDTRGYQAGYNAAKAIVEMVNLMYQNNTAKRFYIGFIGIINRELKNRKIDIKGGE